MIYREINDPDKRTQFNWHSGLRKWVDPKPVDDKDPDCPACLRGIDHTLKDHERNLARAGR